MVNLSILLAFVAGLFSFLSPCVLPLIPSWLCFLGGTVAGPPKTAAGRAPEDAATAGVSEASAPKPRFIPITVSFILGFSAVFVVLSILLSGTFLLIGGLSRIITMAAGIVVIILGLNMIFNFLAFLNYEKRFHLTQRPRGLVGGFLAGAAFGAGWTPCVGPILGSILLLAGQDGQMGRAALYLGAYSAGLGLPFLVAAVFFDHLRTFTARLRAHLTLIQRLSGALLILIGLFILLGRYQALNRLLIQSEYAFIDWVLQGGPWVRCAPALLFFLIAALPLMARGLRRKPLSRGILIFSGIFTVLCILQAAGFLDSAGLLAQWFSYRQGI
ncbi:cytochrome c biogenesis CcdA family protein [Treponema sp. TIM-1]|uniref:cytochrome c biogenesis CcdA family protein n=1 Tax=Treponema sp. TIM-1 TaxID=2898417 RepID=UPI0039817292